MKKKIIICGVVITAIAILYAMSNYKGKDIENNEQESVIEINEPHNPITIAQPDTSYIKILECKSSYTKYDEKKIRDSILVDYLRDRFDTLYADDDIFYGHEHHREPSRHYIFNNKGLLIGPLLITEIDSCGVNKYSIEQLGKSMVLDFNDKNSIKELADYNSVKSHFYRTLYDHNYKVTYFSDLTEQAYYGGYNLFIDFPDKNMKYHDEISRWITNILYNDINEYEEDSDSSTSNKYETEVTDLDSLSKLLADKYFAYIKRENSNVFFPRTIMYLSHDLRAMIVNDNYVTYQMFTSGYSGGAHGYYTEELISFDPVTNKDIDWNYLFRPECSKDVENVFLESAAKNKNINEWFDTSGSLFNVFASHFKHMKFHAVLQELSTS